MSADLIATLVSRGADTGAADKDGDNALAHLYMYECMYSVYMYECLY